MKYQKKSFRRKINKKKITKASKKFLRKKFQKRTTSKKLQLVRPVPTGFSNSSSRLVYKSSYSKKLYQTLGAQCHFTNIKSGGQTAPVNEQCVSVVYPMFTGTNVVGLANEDLQYLNTSLVVPTTTSSAAVQTNQKSFKIYLHSVVSTTTFTNASATNIEIEIYDLVAKNTREAYASPDSDWNNGITDERIGGGSTGNNLNTPYAMPTTIKKFNMNWHVARRTKASLGVGRSHEHVFSFKPQRVIDTQYADEFEIIRGVTCMQMVVARAGIADDQNSTVLGNVAIARTKLLYVNRSVFNTTMVSSTPRHYSNANNLFQLEGPLYVKEEDGDVINTQVAANYA